MKKEETVKPRFKAYEQSQGLFLQIVPEDQFDKYSLEKIVNRFVEEDLDMSIFNKNYKNIKEGNTAYDPKSILKVILFSFSKGIISSRKIEENLKYHISYIYLSGEQHFDHTTICRFITTNDEGIKNVFSQLLCLLKDLNLIDWEDIEVDGTIVSGNASKRLSGKEEDFDKLHKRCERYSQKLIERSKKLNQSDRSQEYIKDEERKIKRQKQQYENTIKKIKVYKEKVKNKEISPKDRVNLTDKDTLLFKERDQKGYTQGYNPHCSFSRNDILLDITTHDSQKDSLGTQTRIATLKELKEALGVKQKSRYLMDKGFFSSKAITPSLKNEDDIYIAIPEKIKHKEIHFYEGKPYLNYEGELLLGKLAKSNNRFRYRFAYYEEGIRKFFSIEANFVKENKLWKSYHDKMNSEEGKAIYAKRIGKEHNHHTLKELGGMRRVFRRGKKRVHTEFLLHGIAHNLKKLRKLTIEREIQLIECAI